MTARHLVLAVLVAGAAAAPAGAQLPPSGTDSDIASGKAQKALDAAKAKWKAKGASSYQMVVRRSCFCPVQITRPHTVVIRHGKIARADENVRDFATVPRLFRIVQKAIDKKVQNLDVSYDATRGFPRAIFVDTSLQIADEEQGYGASRFKRL
jgi:hypothetical protein